MNTGRIKWLFNKSRLEKTFLKVISLILSGFLWFYVLNSEPQVIRKVMKVEFKTPKALAVSGLSSTTIEVEMKGARTFINDILSKEEKVVIDLNKYPYKKGKDFNIHIGPNDIAVPFGVSVLSVTPNALEIRLDRKINKYVPIRANIVGELPSELKIVSSSVAPKKVLIEGPVEVMRKIGQIRTLPIDISEFEGSGVFKGTLVDLDHRIKYDRDQVVDYSYEVKAKKANMTLKNIPIRFLSSKKIVGSSHKKVSIDILAPDGISIKASQVQVVADVPDRIKRRAKIKLKAKLPEGVHLLQINPQSINVRVK